MVPNFLIKHTRKNKQIKIMSELEGNMSGTPVAQTEISAEYDKGQTRTSS